MTTERLCVLLAIVGCVAIVVGVGLVLSPGAACVVAGMLAVAAAILLHDPEWRG